MSNLTKIKLGYSLETKWWISDERNNDVICYCDFLTLVIVNLNSLGLILIRDIDR